MTRSEILLLVLPLICTTGTGVVSAQTGGADQQEYRMFEFLDEDGDGVNDVFRDEDGDGTNDVTGEAYPHGFRFLDENRDGRNDLWADADGDGVNDLGWVFGKGEKARAEMNVLDNDGDGVNDVTGRPYDEENYGGGDVGFIDEESERVHGSMIDENADGIDDRLERARRGQGKHGRDRDVFIDEDGDGICDGRGDMLRRTRRGDSGRARHGGGNNR